MALPPAVALQNAAYLHLLDPHSISNCEERIKKGKRWIAISLLMEALPIAAILANALGFAGHLSGVTLCCVNLGLITVSTISFCWAFCFNSRDRLEMVAITVLLVAGFIIANSLCLAGKIDYAVIPWLTFCTPIIGLIGLMFLGGIILFKENFEIKETHERQLENHHRAMQARQMAQQASQRQREAELALNLPTRCEELREKLVASVILQSQNYQDAALNNECAALKAAFIRDYGLDAFNECERQAQSDIERGKLAFAAAHGPAINERG